MHCCFVRCRGSPAGNEDKYEQVADESGAIEYLTPALSPAPRSIVTISISKEPAQTLSLFEAPVNVRAPSAAANACMRGDALIFRLFP